MILVMVLGSLVPLTFMPIVDDPFDFGRIAATMQLVIFLPWAVNRLWQLRC